MIERLNQLSLSDFIELSCGDHSVLLSPGESANDEEVKERASQLIIEYNSIVAPSGMKAALMESEEVMKESAKILLLRICQSLISLKCYDEVREVLAILSLDPIKSDEQVESKVAEMLNSALFLQKRNNELRLSERRELPAPEQIRSSFDADIAFMMTHFKMNIDINVTSATIYANIVAQADRDIRRKLTMN